ncbi:MAG: 16S rRNA (cytosine(1402)-N(4))-methyltransferase RsmH [Alphaproteobacteria bacterium]|nr:16S rRNA (cytosine(1402)-N(4))-methyltransferase RsmH [Alphaproteobacteria bacterium]
MPHQPVLLAEVLDALKPVAGCIYVDGTFGAGGYSRALLQAAPCRVIAIDRDPSAAAYAAKLGAEFGARFVFMQGCFGDVEDLLRKAGFSKVDGFVLDLGVSSMQLDEAQRGFSFRFDAPLDMRMDPTSGQSAADLVNTANEKTLADILFQYGEERASRRIARKIIEIRKSAPITTTGALADLIRAVVSQSFKDKSDPATRSFQALRIAVNDELGELRRALGAAPRILRPGGRFAAVSFHSLEDRLVKDYLKDHSGRAESGSRYRPQTQSAPALFVVENARGVTASAEETKANPRARSARLRWAVRTETEASV